MQTEHFKSKTLLLFEAKFSLLLGIPTPYARTSDVLIIAQRRLSTLTQYLTWLGKSPTSTAESILLEIEKVYKTNTWRRRITSLYSTPSSLAALAATAMVARLLSLQLSLLVPIYRLQFAARLLPLQLSLSLY